MRQTVFCREPICPLFGHFMLKRSQQISTFMWFWECLLGPAAFLCYMGDMLI